MASSVPPGVEANILNRACGIEISSWKQNGLLASIIKTSNNIYPPIKVDLQKVIINSQSTIMVSSLSVVHDVRILNWSTWAYYICAAISTKEERTAVSVVSFEVNLPERWKMQSQQSQFSFCGSRCCMNYDYEFPIAKLAVDVLSRSE